MRCSPWMTRLSPRRMNNAWVGRFALASALVACSGAPTEPAPTAREQTAGISPAAADVVAPVIDTSCNDTCCLSLPLWSAGIGRSSEAETTQARETLKAANANGGAPAVLALSLRALSASSDPADASLAEARLSDERPAGPLPRAMVGQAAQACYLVRWEPGTVSSEALSMLSRIHATPFRRVTDYQSWKASVGDMEASPEIWVKRLSVQTPPPAESVRRLRAKGDDLFVRVMAELCGRSACGMGPEVAAALAHVHKAAGALAWLRGESLPPTATPSIRTFVLEHGDAIFDAASAPALREVLATVDLPERHRAALHVLLAHLDPPAARRLRAAALESCPGARDLVLQDIAARDPGACAQACAPFFFKKAGEVDAETRAVLRGLRTAGDAGKRAFHQLVRQGQIGKGDHVALADLVETARAHGCVGLPPSATLRPYAGKNASPADAEQVRQAASRAQETAIQTVRGCARTK